MAELKGVIFGWDNVLLAKGSLAPHAATLAETGKLVQFFHKRGVEIVVVTNQKYVLKDKTTGKETPAKEYFENAWGVTIDHHLCGQDGGAGKQSQAGFQAILAAKGWKPNNVVIVGNSETDMQMAVVNKVLLLTAKWYPDTLETTAYGFHFNEPKGIARFVDVFCLRGHHWFYKIEDGNVQVYALAPFGTSDYYSESKYYSSDFLNNIKNEMKKDEDFWAKFLATSMYFSGLYEKVDYFTAYPKHKADQWPEILVGPMDTFGKSFNKRYIPDLIRRHTTAVKSQYNRDTVDHANQLNTIQLSQLPIRIVKGEEKKYANFPIKEGKTVLVIDDVCTKGMSFEAARCYLNGLGINVISVAFLKARNHSYASLAEAKLPFGAFGKNKVSNIKPGKLYSYREHIVDTETVAELTDRLKRYQNWKYPS
jgi:predicted amidophosphoribosyltransferase